MEQAEKRCKESLDEARSYHENELANKQQFLATLHSLMGTCMLEQGKFTPAETNFQKDYEISEEINHFEGCSRALDNLGRVSVKLEKFDKAIQYWESKLQLLQQQRTSTSQQTGATGDGEKEESRDERRARKAKETALERTWLYHEIGRCHLELKNNSEAKEYGERALASAKTSEDEVWQLNALVLTAKAEAQMEEYQSAAESFEKALELSKELQAKNAQKAIESALRDVNNKIVRGVKTEESVEEEQEQKQQQQKEEQAAAEEQSKKEESAPSPQQTKKESIAEDSKKDSESKAGADETDASKSTAGGSDKQDTSRSGEGDKGEVGASASPGGEEETPVVEGDAAAAEKQN